MRRIIQWVLLISFAAAGCTSTGSTRHSLEPLLPETEPDNVRFFHGSWIRPDSIYAFHLTESGIYVADPLIGESEAQVITADDCPMLKQAYKELVVAITESVKIASGEIAIDEPDEIILDGPDYRVEFWSRISSTTVVLQGGSNAQLVTPWVDSAYQVRAIADECTRGE